MILLDSTDNTAFRVARTAYPEILGWFLKPRKYGIPKGVKAGATWACDNDCYNLGDKFNFGDFLGWLGKLQDYRANCLFVPAPDVVGDHAATLVRFYKSAPQIRAMGFPVAFVLQDGCAGCDVPWDEIDAVFVGGTTEYKLSHDVIKILIEASQIGKWRHIGRVNSMVRINHFYDFADSFDGTGFARRPDYHLRWVKNHLLWLKQQPRLGGL